MTHRVELIQQATGLWDVRCACGWVNQGFKTKRQAEADADDHIIILSRCGDNDKGAK